MLLDTNVISELTRRMPNGAVVAFVRALAPKDTFTAAICEAEINFGLARMPHGRRRENLAERLADLFSRVFAEQVLPFDRDCARLYGSIRAGREAMGRPIAVEDAMIAATARTYGATVATRNVDDFLHCETNVVDPWSTG